MKKILAVLVAAIMVMGLSVTAFAEESIMSPVYITGDVQTITTTGVTLTRDEVKTLIGDDVLDYQISVIWQADLTVTKLPATLSFTVNGTAAPQEILIFHFVDGAWKLEGSGDAKTVTITCDAASPFAIVLYTPIVGVYKSPKTGETNAAAAALITVIAAGAVAFVLAPKRPKKCG